MPLKTTIDEQPTLNLTSMIDVLFLLIIFFMVGTRFIEPERDIDLKVPEVNASGALTDAPSKKIINVYQDGRLVFDQQTVSLGELTQRLQNARGQYDDLGVLVRGDAQTAFQRVAEVLNACKDAGISELGISVRMASTSRTTR